MNNQTKYSESLENISNILSNEYRFIKEIPYSRIKPYEESKKIENQVKKQKQTKQEKASTTPVNECMAAAIVRIRDIIKYLDTKQSVPDTFAEFTSIIIQIDILKVCIDTLAKAFEVDINKDNSDIFQHKQDAITKETEEKNKEIKEIIVNDNQYFRYIRSLCFAHPLGTDQHDKFQGGEFEWCRYVDPKSFINVLNSKLKNSDFVARVGTSKSSLDKTIPLYYKEFLDYADYLYSFLPVIEIGAIKYIDDCNDKLKNEKLKEISDFDKYIEYLFYLLLESEKRVGNDCSLESAITLFLIDMESDKNKKLLEEYRNIVKGKIATFHTHLQSMTPDFDFEFGVIPDYDNKNFDSYFLQKLEYVQNYCDKNREGIALENIKKQTSKNGIKNKRKMTAYLSQSYSETNQQSFGISCTNSEWTRALAYKYNEDFSKYIDLDFWASDWNVYWQIQIAFLQMLLKAKTEKLSER